MEKVRCLTTDKRPQKDNDNLTSQSIIVNLHFKLHCLIRTIMIAYYDAMLRPDKSLFIVIKQILIYRFAIKQSIISLK